jgi:hypothetical protein
MDVTSNAQHGLRSALHDDPQQARDRTNNLYTSAFTVKKLIFFITLFVVLFNDNCYLVIVMMFMNFTVQGEYFHWLIDLS